MKKYSWITISILAGLVVLQPFLSKWLSISGVAFNFVIFGVMISAFGKQRRQALVATAAVGVVYDMLYSPWLGRSALVMIIGVMCVFAVDKIVYRENMPALAPFFFVSTYLVENLNSLLETGFAVYFQKFAFIQKTVFGLSVYAAGMAAISGVIFFIGSMRADRRLAMKRGGR
jgi:rod shape-determining protein MreD